MIACLQTFYWREWRQITSITNISSNSDEIPYSTELARLSINKDGLNMESWWSQIDRILNHVLFSLIAQIHSSCSVIRISTKHDTMDRHSNEYVLVLSIWCSPPVLTVTHKTHAIIFQKCWWNVNFSSTDQLISQSRTFTLPNHVFCSGEFCFIHYWNLKSSDEQLNFSPSEDN